MRKITEDKEDLEDSALYAYLSATDPDGKVILSQEESDKFTEWLEEKSKEGNTD